MIERLLENWLNRANERSFQYPFCYWLASQGLKFPTNRGRSGEMV